MSALLLKSDLINPEMVIAYAIFGFVFLFIFISVVITVVRKMKRDKILKYGKKQVAKYLRTFEGKVVTRTVNDRVVSSKQYYGVEYEFRSQEGKLLKARSDGNYTLADLQAFQKAGYFEVYVLEDESEIPGVPSVHMINKYQQLKNTKTCAYCGSKVAEATTKCSSCGSSKFERIL